MFIIINYTLFLTICKLLKCCFQLYEPATKQLVNTVMILF